MHPRLSKLHSLNGYFSFGIFLVLFSICTSDSFAVTDVPHGIRIQEGIESKDLKIRIFPAGDLKKAKEFLALRKSYISSLFAPESDPYRGKVEQPKPCQAKNLKDSFREHEGGGFLYARNLYASKNRLLGDCRDMSTAYRVKYNLLYCPEQNRVYTLTYFYRRDQGWLADNLVECRRDSNKK